MQPIQKEVIVLDEKEKKLSPDKIKKLFSPETIKRDLS